MGAKKSQASAQIGRYILYTDTSENMPSSDARKEKLLFAEIKRLPQCILNIVADYNPPGLMEHQQKMKLIIATIHEYSAIYAAITRGYIPRVCHPDANMPPYLVGKTFYFKAGKLSGIAGKTTRGIRITA